MKFENGSPAAENLAVLGANYLFKEGKLNLSAKPSQVLTSFDHNDRRCAAVTSPRGYITVLYGVRRNFETLARNLADGLAGQVVEHLEPDRILNFCRAYVIATFTPGSLATLTIVEAEGSARAAVELRKRIVPVRGLFLSPPQHSSPHRPPRGKLWIGCRRPLPPVLVDENGDIVRVLTDEEMENLPPNRTQEGLAAFYYTTEILRGVH